MKQVFSGLVFATLLVLNGAAFAETQHGAYRSCKLNLRGQQTTLDVYLKEYVPYKASIGKVVQTTVDKDSKVEQVTFDNAIIGIGGWIGEASATYIDQYNNRIELQILDYDTSTYEAHRLKLDMDCGS